MSLLCKMVTLKRTAECLTKELFKAVRLYIFKTGLLVLHSILMPEYTIRITFHKICKQDHF